MRLNVPDARPWWTRLRETPAGCWLWTGTIHTNGYGTFRERGKKHYAHRRFFERFNGPIPPGHHVCHSCDVPICVNPLHLFTGTAEVNIRDAGDKKRLPWGERNHFAKLSASDVLAIRAQLAAGATQKDIAAQYGIDPSCVSNIKTRRNWRHLEDASC